MENKNYSPKDILDKFQPLIIRKDKIWINKDGQPQVKNEPEKYTPEDYDENIVLQVAPKDAIIIEFEDTPEKNKRFIAEMEESCRSLGIEYCVTSHNGKSDYLRIYNIKGIPVNYDNKIAKDLLIETLISSGAREQLDKTNLGWTLSPVIGHSHWKPKYKGTIHKIIRGIHPLKQRNEYPKKLLRQINKSKKLTKINATELLRKNQWVNDFLINHCSSHILPKGQRHYIIEKNLAVLLYHRTDKKEILNKYLKAQGRKTNTLRTWFNAISGGQYTEVSVLEVKKYIKENNIDYNIPSNGIAGPDEGPQDITPEELNILTDPDLLNLINKQLDKTIVGEHESRKTIILNACGKFVENANISSYNLCINSNSGAGKDYITKNTLKIFHSKDVEIRSRISPTALTYWHNSKFEPEWTWNGKVLVLLDISNTILNCDVFKLMCSDETHSTITIEQRAYDIKIQGKPVIFITTASANPKNEMLRRFPFMQLDETIDQTKAIKKAQAKAAKEGITLKYDSLITSALSKLKRVKIKIPFADKLIDEFPDEHIIMRTHFSRLLDYIKASAALYQYQREKDEDGFILAETIDYDNATIPLSKTTSNPMMIPLSKKQHMLLEECKKLGNFSAKELEPHIPFLVQSKIYSYLDKLQEYGFLTSYNKETGESKKPVRFYSYVDFNIEKIPTWKDIENNCRKKGIKGIEEIKEIKKNEGNDIKDMEKTIKNSINDIDKNNSHKSLISPSKSYLNEKKFLNDRILELTNYCKKLVADGYKITYNNLCFNFDKMFIDKCIDNKILIVLPDGTYDI